jgi:hypothetical protein
VKWSKPGLELLENAHYKFLSPYWEAEQSKHIGRTVYKPTRLISVGLTNDPNIPVLPLANTTDADSHILGPTQTMNSTLNAQPSAIAHRHGQSGSDPIAHSKTDVAQASLPASSEASSLESPSTIVHRPLPIAHSETEDTVGTSASAASTSTSSQTSPKTPSTQLSKTNPEITKTENSSPVHVASAARTEGQGEGGLNRPSESANTEIKNQKSKIKNAPRAPQLEELNVNNRESTDSRKTPEKITPTPTGSHNSSDTGIKNHKSEIINDRLDALASRVAALDHRLRTFLTDSAIANAKITPAQRDYWLAELKTDFENHSKKLMNLAPAMKTTALPNTFAERSNNLDNSKFRTTQIQNTVKEKMKTLDLTYDQAWSQIKQEHPEWFQTSN